MQRPAAESAVLGIDPSLAATGMCAVLDGRYRLTETWTTAPEQHRPARLLQLRDKLCHLITATKGQLAGPHSTLIVAMESEIWMGNPTQSSDASAVQAVYQQTLWELDPQHQWLHYLPVNVAHVKKWLGAKGKDEILLQVFKRYKVEFRDHNQADAFTLGMIGHAFYIYTKHGQTWPDWTQPQVEVLDKLQKSGFVWEATPRHKVRKGKRPLPL